MCLSIRQTVFFLSFPLIRKNFFCGRNFFSEFFLLSFVLGMDVCAHNTKYFQIQRLHQMREKQTPLTSITDNVPSAIFMARANGVSMRLTCPISWSIWCWLLHTQCGQCQYLDRYQHLLCVRTHCQYHRQMCTHHWSV